MKELADFLNHHGYGFVNFVDWAFIHELLIKLPADVNATITDSLYETRTISLYGAILERFNFIPKGWISQLIPNLIVYLIYCQWTAKKFHMKMTILGFWKLKI